MSGSFGRDKRAIWEGLLRQFPASGLSVREFCRRRGVSEPSFYAWRRRMRAAGGPAVPAVPLFVPLRVAAGRVAAGRVAAGRVAAGDVGDAGGAGGAGGEPARIELLLAGGVTVRLFGEVSAARLASVLQALGCPGLLGESNGKGGRPC